MDKPYYFGVNNQQVGPLDEKATRQHITSGNITQNTLAWCQGMTAWKPVSEIPELMQNFAALWAEQVKPPPLPTGAQRETPPPLPSLHQGVIPPGLTPWEEKSYRFVAWSFRPRFGKGSPILDYVNKNPKRALPISAAIVGLYALTILWILSSITDADKKAQQQLTTGQTQPGQIQQGMAQPNWAAFQRASQDAHNFSMGVMDDVYKYKRDAGDRMDETYKRANYDWYRNND